jgi:hypothetical protein
LVIASPIPREAPEIRATRPSLLDSIATKEIYAVSWEFDEKAARLGKLKP